VGNEVMELSEKTAFFFEPRMEGGLGSFVFEPGKEGFKDIQDRVWR